MRNFIIQSLMILLLLGCATSKKAETPPATPAPTSTVDKEAIRKVIREHLAEVSNCYEESLKVNKTLSGKLVLEWDINGEGKVNVVKIAQSVDPKLDECVANNLRIWAFPPAPNKTVTNVRYPFMFSPKKTAEVKQ